MRNWNSQTIFRFAIGVQDLSYLWGIETKKTKHLGIICKRIYLTYEELKFKVVSGRYGFALGSILPMRNWNQDLDEIIIDPAKDLSYLWGIETAYWLRTTASRWMDLSYLWGIETDYMYERKGSHARIYLTYEELKHFPGQPTDASLLKGSILPMRNWNWRSAANTCEMPGSILPMRNWNLA